MDRHGPRHLASKVIDMVRAISILGSTGSIGRQTAQAARRLGIPVLALAARRDVDTVEEQAREFRPRYIAMFDPAAAPPTAPSIVFLGEI